EASILDARGHSANNPACHRACDAPTYPVRSNPEDQEFRPACSCICPFEFALAEYLRDFHVVVLVPALASRPLGRHVARVGPPRLQCLAVLPPDHREPLAIFCCKTLYV